MVEYRLSQPAAEELDLVLGWSEHRFYSRGRGRYATLLFQAIKDLADDPQRPGVEWVSALRTTLGVYHVWHSRNSVPEPSERVREPRHLIVFRIAADGAIDILGVIHDSMARSRALHRIIRANASDLQ